MTDTHTDDTDDINDARHPGHPPIVSHDDWRAARIALLADEKAYTRAGDALSARRRRLPMVAVTEPYDFRGPDGAATLRDMFGDHRQLIVYHFMFDPSWEAGCPSCTHLSDEVGPGHLAHLADSDTAYVAISRAPIEKIQRYRTERGWTFPWYSSFGTSFNHDFHVTLDPSVAPVEYNFKDRAELEALGHEFDDGDSSELPGISTFMRLGDDIFHTYSTFARGAESIGGSHYLLDLTVYGRQQTFEDSPTGWPQQPTYGDVTES
ncbi:MAG: DUF899 domain-containing protein [Ilumatobacteraceae bacterium]